MAGDLPLEEANQYCDDGSTPTGQTIVQLCISTMQGCGVLRSLSCGGKTSHRLVAANRFRWRIANRAKLPRLYMDHAAAPKTTAVLERWTNQTRNAPGW